MIVPAPVTATGAGSYALTAPAPSVEPSVPHPLSRPSASPQNGPAGRGPAGVRRLGLLAAALLLLAACGGGQDPVVEPGVTATPPDATATTTPAPDGTTAPASPTPTESPGTPFAANTEADSGDSSGDLIAVTDVTTSAHPGFDRVTFAIGGGDGQAGWEASYVDDPRSQGSGDQVEVAGGATLRVTITNVGLPPDTGGETYEGPERLTPRPLEAVTEIVDDSIFEGRHVFFVGTTDRTPFRVRRDADTGAVVLEVRHSG